MVQTTTTAVSLLEVPSHMRSNTETRGGHSFRRGGVQHVCSEGVELSKFAATARATSNSILSYVDNSHLKATTTVAREIAQERSGDQPLPEPAPLVPTTDIGPTPARPYVKATRPRSKIHIKWPIHAGTTRCRL